MKKVLKILTPNRKINYRGKQVRTPVIIVGEEKEINEIGIELRKLGSMKFSVEPYIKEQKSKITTEQKIKEPIIEKIEEPLTILEKLLQTKD